MWLDIRSVKKQSSWFVAIKESIKQGIYDAFFILPLNAAVFSLEGGIFCCVHEKIETATVIAYIGNNHAKFVEVFKKLGVVVKSV